MALGVDHLVLHQLKSSWSALVAGGVDIVNLQVLVVAHKE
tara:strand:- start:402 stop:521 length:120 start_codon:yes stop_codon:yes gene_type:complete